MSAPGPIVSDESRNYWTVGLLFAIGGVLCFSLRPILIKLAYRLAAGSDYAARAADGVCGAVLRRRGRVVAPQRRGRPVPPRDMVYVVDAGSAQLLRRELPRLPRVAVHQRGSRSTGAVPVSDDRRAAVGGIFRAADCDRAN